MLPDNEVRKLQFITAADIRARLRKRYGGDAYAILFEVASATGANNRRWADAMAMNLWPSRGLYLEGFEIKISRHDWLKEMKSPEKADEIAKYCDYWWLVTSDVNVVSDPDAELPRTWGWMVVDGDGLRVVKHAEKLDPQPLDRLFVASMLRSAGKVDRGEVGALVKEQVDRERARIEEEIERRVAQRTDEAGQLTKIRDLLVTEFGSLKFLDETDLVNAIKIVRAGGITARWEGVQHIHKEVSEFAGRLKGVLTEMGIQVEPPKPEAGRRRKGKAGISVNAGF